MCCCTYMHVFVGWSCHQLFTRSQYVGVAAVLDVLVSNSMYVLYARSAAPGACTERATRARPAGSCPLESTTVSLRAGPVRRGSCRADGRFVCTHACPSTLGTIRIEKPSSRATTLARGGRETAETVRQGHPYCDKYPSPELQGSIPSPTRPGCVLPGIQHTSQPPPALTRLPPPRTPPPPAASEQQLSQKDYLVRPPTRNHRLRRVERHRVDGPSVAW